MNPRSLVRSVLVQAPIAAAIGLALGLIADLRGHGVFGLLAAIGTGCVVAALPLIDAVYGPPQPEAYQLPGWRRPFPVLTGPRSQAVVGMIVLTMIPMMWWLPGWAAFLGMVLAGIGLVTNLAMAYSRRRGRPRHRAELRQAVQKYQPKFVVYTARQGDASYQLSAWIPILERLGMPYLVVLRHAEGVPSTRPITDAPILVLPSGSDLDAITVPGMSVAFYVNGIAENLALVNYRSMIHVHLGHGDSDKQSSVNLIHSMFDLVFVAGRAAIDRYQKAGVIIPPSKFVIVGRPQLARLEKANGPIRNIEQPTVLFAPTWRGYNAQTTVSSLPVGAAIVNALIRRGAVVDFRAHPFSWLGSGERSQITAVDEILRQDRQASGRQHRLAAECRSMSIAEAFDASDALITDIGSVLVDYFATGKPYAVVLPAGQDATTARTDVPSTIAAYLIEYDDLRGPGARGCADVLDDLLYADPLAGQRPAVARHYLGDRPGDDRQFLDEVRKLITDPPRAHQDPNTSEVSRAD